MKMYYHMRHTLRAHTFVKTHFRPEVQVFHLQFHPLIFLTGPDKWN